MTCKLSGLFSIGEEFDDEDLLGTDWAVHSASGPANAAAAASPCALRASSAARGEPEKDRLQPTGEISAASWSGTARRSGSHAAGGQTVSPGLRQIPSARPRSLRPPVPGSPPPKSAAERAEAREPVKPGVAQDDFDDWDVDLEDLDECEGRMGPPLRAPPPAPPPPSANTLRPLTCGGTALRRDQTASSSNNPPPWTRPAPFLPPPPQRHVFSAPSPFSVTLNRPHVPQRVSRTPGPSPQARSLFETISPAPRSAGLNTPVLTNRLVQLVSASNKLPRKRARSEPCRTRTRRFPGPAGLLPEQPSGRNLDEIVVSAPVTPAHGAVARLPSQGSGSQAEEDDFCGDAWTAMRTDMGLDERNPSCFLHSYSVVMVLRKAALKQLAKNKVPNMAVVLKSIVDTTADAKAVFKDPTGEIQGTVHRQLLEDRAEELKVGAVLLLKQVGVFSPSHRNHYLNVTPNNLLRIYAPDGVCLTARLPPLVSELMLTSPPRPPRGLREPVSQMQLVFDEEDDEGQVGVRCTEEGEDPSRGAKAGPGGSLQDPSPQHSSWESDAGLDELLGALPDDTYSF
ncbi:homologous recombination OB-fold protein [Brachionichthys hirsutus]|uniref:homologous recombination OB-fold protein n=1 Tax=Brachionichthys hirsutus TaxID=412623 RepID=UPI003604DFC0